jgi:hypothetical protein
MSIITITNSQDANTQLQTALGTKKPIVVDISATDFVVPVNCRVMTSVGGTKIVVDMLCVDGAITGVVLPAIGAIPIVNITKIIKVGTDAENILLWPIDF